MQLKADCSPDGSGLAPAACLGGQYMTQKLPCTASAWPSPQGHSWPRTGPAVAVQATSGGATLLQHSPRAHQGGPLQLLAPVQRVAVLEHPHIVCSQDTKSAALPFRKQSAAPCTAAMQAMQHALLLWTRWACCRPAHT